MSVKVDLKPTSVISLRLGIQNKGPVHKFFTHTCAIHMDKYVPYRTGTLATTVVEGGNTTSNVTEDTITYAQKYAIYPYMGIRKNAKFEMNGKSYRLYKNMHYGTDKHSLAGPHWDKRMWTAEKNDIVKEVQDYVKKHGGKK